MEPSINQSNNTQTASKISTNTLILLILLPIITLFIGVIIGQTTTNERSPEPTPNNKLNLEESRSNSQTPQYNPNNQQTNQNLSDCPVEGSLPASTALKRYTIQPGDTYTSISNYQLLSPTRANDIAKLNIFEGMYSEESLDLPLETGRQILLPPITPTQTGQNIQLYGGKIKSIQTNNFDMVFSGGGGGLVEITPDTQFPLKRRSDFKIGDCIIKFQDVGMRVRVLFVLPQTDEGLNFFKNQ
jgi:hypothetical protein